MAKARWVAAFLVVLLGVLLWLEHGNRIAIAPPQVTEYRPCADSDAVPYSAQCIEFMMGTGLQSRPEAVN